MFTTHVPNLLLPSHKKIEEKKQEEQKQNKQTNKQTNKTTGNGVKLFACMFVKQLAYTLKNLTFRVTKSIFPGVFGNTPFLTL